VKDAGWAQRRRRSDRGFAVVRHPVDRWYSGVHQYVRNNRLDAESVFEEARRGRFEFDVHTWPQVRFLVNDPQLVALENAVVFLEGLGVVMGHLRNQRVEYGTPAEFAGPVLDYYAEDLGLYEFAC
jgi:hypothetical protein